MVTVKEGVNPGRGLQEKLSSLYFCTVAPSGSELRNFGLADIDPEKKNYPFPLGNFIFT